MKKYRQINEWDRWQIYALLHEEKSNTYIAKKLWFDVSNIGREIKRNSVNWKYEPAFAQREYERRRSEINKGRNKLKNDEELLQDLKSALYEWSPDSRAWRRKLEWKIYVCPATVYKYIDEREPGLKKELKYKRWYKRRWSKDKRWAQKEWFKSIEQRPIEANTRERIWDIEIDTIHSSWTERKWWIVTIVDRKTKFLAWWKVDQRTAKKVADVLIREMKLFPKEKLLTITADNGKEFFDFERVESSLKTPLYFAHTYASYERPTNEQTNGMLRVFFPKWTDFSKVSEEEIQKAIDIINHKPRKSLNYLCAYEAFHGIRLNL